MLHYLVDSSICIELLRNNQKVTQQFVLHDREIALSTITELELYNGAYHAPEKYFEKELSVVRKLLSMFPTISISGATELFAREKKRLEAQGTPIEDFDLIIACTAVANDMVVVTNNTKHFSRIEGFKFENWTK